MDVERELELQAQIEALRLQRDRAREDASTLSSAVKALQRRREDEVDAVHEIAGAMLLGVWRAAAQLRAALAMAQAPGQEALRDALKRALEELEKVDQRAGYKMHDIAAELLVP